MFLQLAVKLSPRLRRFSCATLLGIVCLGGTSFGLAATSWSLEPTRGDNEILVSDDAAVKLRRFSAYRLPNRKERFNLIWAVIPTELYQARVQIVNSDGVLKGLAQCRGDLAISGGFWEDHKSKGWVVSDGKPMSPPADFKDGGAFIVTDKGPQIIRKTEFSRYADVDQALQSTPIIIFDGRYDGASEEVNSWNRVGLGVTADGNIIAALVYGPEHSLADFGRLLVNLSEGGHSPRIVAMISLDSNITGTIRLRRESRHFGSEGGKFTPNIVCFERRRSAR